MANNKSGFNGMLNRFYENGLLKEVYKSETATVCNAFDQFYIAFSNELVAQYEDGRFPGFIMNSNGLRSIVEDNNFVNRYFGSLSSKGQDEVLVLLDETLFQHFATHKAEFSKRPPRVDLAYEQQVMAMQGKQGELASMLEEQQAQSLAAAQYQSVPSQK
ncbi:MAG: hypothetical protein J6C28_00395 [Bacilli bacterium]|nr:hypothetical protein [Bacilli bacterium]